MKNNLPQYWAVKNDGSQQFKDTVLKYLNKPELDYKFPGTAPGWLYGINKYGNALVHLSPDQFGGNVLTLEQFIEMTTEKTEVFSPKRGDRVLASNDGIDWFSSHIYVTTVEGAALPIIVVEKGDEEVFSNGKAFDIVVYKYMKPFPAIELTLPELLKEAAKKRGVAVEQIKIKE